ncbi:unnamed protein product [Rotaria sp. Silwood2]|nr:unnamed protein product [Rotaria sp. Silwood2]CAF4733253.1 unnamed protein product [Rotaria sp. Silwood2]
MDNYDILHELDSVARSIRSSQPFYSQAEYVPETPAILKANGGPVDACWSSSFHGIVAGVLADQSNFNLDQMKYIIGAPYFVNYLSSHDNERLLFLLGKNSNIFDDEAFKCMRLASILLITSVGVPLIQQGAEFGEARELGSDEPNKKKLPMQWDLLNNERNRLLFDTFKRLLELRKSRDDMTDNNVNFFYDHFDNRVLAYARSQELVVVVHFINDEKQGYELQNFPENGKWIDWLTNEEYQVDNNTLKVDLRPFDARVLILQK